jgi:hypothetical protein
MAEEQKLATELEKMEYVPLMAVEKKLIAWSLILGFLLLGLMIWTSYTWFPGT